jgi:hypothetical protein
MSQNKFYFCFTLDTEPDNLWEPFSGLRFEHFVRLYDFHQVLTACGAKPVYLTTSEVAESPEAARVLARILATGRAELGAHFHTWTRKWPFEVPPLGVPPLQAMAHQLGQPLEERMLRFTCDTLRRVFGVQPRSYRGGRWSFNQDTVRSLLNTGIVIDSTVTPGRTWQDASHPLLDGPDFRESPRHPFYHRNDSDGPNVGTEEVLEVPVGAGFVSPGWFGAGNGLVARARRRLNVHLGRPQGWLWLRPSSMSRPQLRACMETMRRDNVKVWVSMIHTSEIIPCSKLPTETEVKAFVQRCQQLIEDAVAMGATCATLLEVRTLYDHGL